MIGRIRQKSDSGDTLFLRIATVPPPFLLRLVYLAWVILVILSGLSPGAFAEGEPILMAHWGLDDGTGTTAVDASGGGNDGTLVNMDPTTIRVEGVFGGALEFDGVDDYIRIPHSSDLECQEQFSIALWYRPSRLNALLGNCFIDKSIGVNKCSCILRMNPNNQLELLTNSGGYSNDWKIAATTGFQPVVGIWTHVAVVKDGRSARFYQDGVALQDNDATLDLTLFPNDEELRIGGEGGKSIAGAIDDVRLYQGVLTGEEISGLAKAPRLEGVELADRDGLHNIDPNTFTNETTIAALLKGVEGYVQSVQMAEDDRFIVNLRSYWRPPLGDYDGSTSVSFDLLPGDGERQVWVIVTNPAGFSYPPVSAKITVDTKSPTAALTTDSANPTGDPPIHVIATFSEPVYELTTENIVVGGVGGTISEFAGTEAEYSFDVTPSATGEITVGIAAGSSFDAAGNGNADSAVLTRTYSSNLRTLYTDNFDASHDYSQADVAGTIWEGILGTERIVEMNSSIAQAGELTIVAGKSNSETEQNGVFLYRNVKGDFIAEVEITGFDKPQYCDKGLMARVQNLSDGGPGEDSIQLLHEDSVQLPHFDLYDANNEVRIIDNGCRIYLGTKHRRGNGFLRIERRGDVFYLWTRKDQGNSWVGLPPIARYGLSGLSVQVGIWQSTPGEAAGKVSFDNFSLQLLPDREGKSAKVSGVVKVDGSGNLPGTFANLTAAYEALDRGDGIPDTIDVIVDSIEEETPLTVFGTDDLTVRGDADGNGIPCTIVVSANCPALDINVATEARYTIRDLVIIPGFAFGNKECEAIRYTASADFGSVESVVTLENITVTSSSANDVVVDPQSPYNLENAGWFHAMRIMGPDNPIFRGGNVINVVNCTFGHSTHEVFISYGFASEDTEFNFVGTKILQGRSYGLHFLESPVGTTVHLENCMLSGLPAYAISVENSKEGSALSLARTEVTDSGSAIFFANNGDGSSLNILEGCKFSGIYASSCVVFQPMRAGEEMTLNLQGTEVEPVVFSKNNSRMPVPMLCVFAENKSGYQVGVEHAVFVDNQGAGIQFSGECAEGSTATVDGVLLGGNAYENIIFMCNGIEAALRNCTLHSDWAANEQNGNAPGNNHIEYTDCVFSGKSAGYGANRIRPDQTALKIDYINCALVTQGPDGMSCEYSDGAKAAAITKTDCVNADPIYANTDIASLTNGSFAVRNPTFAGGASDGGVLTGWGKADLLVRAGNLNRPPAFLSETLVKRDALVGRPYSEFLIGDAYDPDDYDQSHLVFSKVDGPKWLEISPDGVLGGTPEKSNLGANRFTVRVKDRLGETDEAALQIEGISKGSVVNYSSAVSPAWVEETVSADVESISAALIDGTTASVIRERPTGFYVDNGSDAIGADVNGATSTASLGLTLDPKGVTGLEIGTKTVAGTSETIVESITWTPTDLFGRNPETEAIVIRRGDSLLVTASGNGSTLEIDADGDGKFETLGSPGDRFPIFCAKPGVYTSAARIDGQNVGGMKILVQDADLDGPIACELQYRREKGISSSLAETAAQVVFTAADSSDLEVAPKIWAADVPTLYLKPLTTGVPLLHARLGHKGGPVIAEEKVDVFTVDSTGLTSVPTLAHYPDGSSLLGIHVAIDPLVRDLDAHIHCFGTGATLDDLSTDKQVSTNEFTHAGEYNFGLVMTGHGVCHWVRFYQQGVQVSRSY